MRPSATTACDRQGPQPPRAPAPIARSSARPRGVSTGTQTTRIGVERTATSRGGAQPGERAHPPAEDEPLGRYPATEPRARTADRAKGLQRVEERLGFGG